MAQTQPPLSLSLIPKVPSISQRYPQLTDLAVEHYRVCTSIIEASGRNKNKKITIITVFHKIALDAYITVNLLVPSDRQVDD